MAIVFQDYSRSLMPWLSVLDNVALPLRSAKTGKVERIEKAMAALIEVGLKDHVQKYPWQLSGGMQQRVAIARALANGPRVVLADEPTGNLDPVTSWEIIKLLVRVNELGTTMVMATHNAEIVNALRRRVVHLDHGMVVLDEREGQYAA
jgi:ABC-type ATPase involved in cell division